MATCLGCGKTGVSGGECPNHTFYSVSPTPEPELNVEAELESCYVALWENIDDSATARRLELKFKRAVQQDGDQKVRGFAQKLKTAKSLQGEPWSWHKSGAAHTAEGREHDKRGDRNTLREWFKTDIDQTLADYLSHKEARDE